MAQLQGGGVNFLGQWGVFLARAASAAKGLWTYPKMKFTALPTYLTFPTTTPTCQKVAKGVGMGLFRGKNQCQTMGQNPYRQGLARDPRVGTCGGETCAFFAVTCM